MSTSVFLADLRHNYTGVLSNDNMPLNVAYMKAVMSRELPEVQTRLFAYPDRLWVALQEDPPDVLMLSNYMWNEALSLHFARLAKRRHPNMLVVFGGPNLPIEEERQVAYVASHPEIDLHVLGEGDFLAAEVVQHFLDAGKALKNLAARDIPSSIYRRPDGELVLQKVWDRRRTVDDIPSPWLTGVLDEFFDGKLSPMIETNRGCPFTCTFCVQGTGWYTKVNYFSQERLREEIDYIGRRIHAVCPSMGVLRIADANYGMFERDVEISGYIGKAQKNYGWPTYIDATTGKNRPERIIRSLEQMSGALVLYQAVQSMDEEVLTNVKRSNIKLDAYEKIQVYVRGRSLRSNSDLIMGLPGEALSTHLEALRKLIDAGTSQLHNFQALLLKGSEMEMVDTRKKFAFETRFRLLPKGFGVYGGAKIFDTEEVVVSTDKLSFEDYLQARKYHLACNTFWNHSRFEDLIRFVENFGVKRSALLEAMLDELEHSKGAARRFLDDFLAETQNELFSTPEECSEFFSHEENFQQLANGEIGDNLIYKYQAIATLRIWPEICACAMEAAKRLMIAHGAYLTLPDFDAFWTDLHRFQELRQTHGATEEALLSPVRVELQYDIGQWLTAGAPLNLTPYKLTYPQTFEFHLTEEGERELKAALQVWTTNLKGLTMLVKRMKTSSQMRHCRLVVKE